jgi:hypothetical protein
MEGKKNKNITKEQEKQFEKLNSIHPTKLKPNEKYEFNLLLGKKYLYLSSLKKYTQNEKKFYRDQGNYFVKYADNIRKRHALNAIVI